MTAPLNRTILSWKLLFIALDEEKASSMKASKFSEVPTGRSKIWCTSETVEALFAVG